MTKTQAEATSSKLSAGGGEKMVEVRVLVSHDIVRRMDIYRTLVGQTRQAFVQLALQRHQELYSHLMLDLTPEGKGGVGFQIAGRTRPGARFRGVPRAMRASSRRVWKGGPSRDLSQGRRTGPRAAGRPRPGRKRSGRPRTLGTAARPRAAVKLPPGSWRGLRSRGSEGPTGFRVGAWAPAVSRRRDARRVRS